MQKPSDGLVLNYENLPGSVHSYQNTLYFAAQMLRSLPGGQAYIHFVDTRVQKPLAFR